MIVVTGGASVSADDLGEALQLAREHSARSRLEPGCISHEPSISADDPHRIQFVEVWADEAALRAHFAVPESGAFVRRLRELAAGPTQMKVYAASEIKL